MIKHSALKPKLRAAAIADWRTELAYEKQSKIAAWGLQVCVLCKMSVFTLTGSRSTPPWYSCRHEYFHLQRSCIKAILMPAHEMVPGTSATCR
jgi:hypothetical protein